MQKSAILAISAFSYAIGSSIEERINNIEADIKRLEQIGNARKRHLDGKITKLKAEYHAWAEGIEETVGGIIEQVKRIINLENRLKNVEDRLTAIEALLTARHTTSSGGYTTRGR